MSEFISIYSKRAGKIYRITHIKSYRVEQSVEVPADSFEFILGNADYSASAVISAGDILQFFVDNKLVIEGYIDDVELEYSNDSNDMRITGRDNMAILLDNDALPKTYNKLGLGDYLGKILPSYDVQYSASNNKKFDKIVISPGETEYSVIERLCNERNLMPIYDCVTDKLLCSHIISSTSSSYTFSNNMSGAIRIINAKIEVSNDIRDEVIVYGADWEKTKKIKGLYKTKKGKPSKRLKTVVTDSGTYTGEFVDDDLRTQKRKVVNDSDIENTKDAQDRAKLEFFNVNKNALTVDITTHTKKPIYINKCARVFIKKAGFDALLYTEKVVYSKSINEGSLTAVTLKLMPGIKVSYNGNEIPVLPILG